MLKITTRSRYAVRILICLGSKGGKRPVQRNEIEDSEGVSIDYAVQILADLRHAGFVESLRGKEGGYFLVVDPDELTVLDVVKAIEGGIMLVRCEGEKCTRISSCVVKPVWERAAEAASRELANVTIGELIAESLKLKKEQSPMYEI